MKSVFAIFLVAVCINAIAQESHDEDKKNNKIEYNVKFGSSPFTGILGLEIQKNKWAIGFGTPLSVSLKRYFREDENSPYLGVYLYDRTQDDFDDYEEGIYFQERQRKSYGIGGGYQWLWKSGWNLSLGGSVGDVKETYSRGSMEMTKREYDLYLDLNVGFKF
ncbi:hypothetical protein PVT68_14775 [Microbulbifer bruguierae]|uniref:Outer membrane protein beta-barrel domain-containing protein n=1 Tax=Microbulbifer bruguierae TaxID=3029061 RepID=A0ABY8ND82_9GAMM|nr:hypothetical protein [Microbulbifer bruguierae]WGL16027.1 hypothetical protein PVT68_14775 [Microbulbifer bruguierae]